MQRQKRTTSRVRSVSPSRSTSAPVRSTHGRSSSLLNLRVAQAPSPSSSFSHDSTFSRATASFQGSRTSGMSASMTRRGFTSTPSPSIPSFATTFTQPQRAGLELPVMRSREYHTIAEAPSYRAKAAQVPSSVVSPAFMHTAPMGVAVAPSTRPSWFVAPSAAPATSPVRFMSKKAGKEKGGKAKGGKDKGGDKSSDGEGVEFSKDPFVEKMQNCVAGYTNELNNIRVGRATPEMLHDILIDYQMKKVPLKSLAQIYTKPPASLIVSLHEHTELLDKTVCTAISNAGMDLAPISETVHGMPAIVVPFPKPTRELRDQLIKQAKAKAEETKINIRHVRKLWNDGIKKAKLPKDDAHRAETECQKNTDKYCDEVTDLASKKEKEINSA